MTRKSYFIKDHNTIYVHSDGEVNRNEGGYGFHIEFPEYINLEPVEEFFGKTVNYNIESLELMGILAGMNKIISLSKDNLNELKKAGRITFLTDRFDLNDEEKTNPYDIAEYRRNKWLNKDNRPIKNGHLFDELDKKRAKISKILGYRVEVKYIREKRNKKADKLATLGSNSLFVGKKNPKIPKIARRIFNGPEINYSSLYTNQKIFVHIYFKESQKDGVWEIYAEFYNGEFSGRKIKIICSPNAEGQIHRTHKYELILNSINKYSVSINEENINEVI